MQTNLFTRMFKGKAKPDAKIFSVTPQRTGERTLLGVENFLGSIAVPDPFSLEIAGDASGVALLARCREDSYARQQLGVHYPHAQVTEVSPDEDPLRLSGRERAWSMELRLTGPEYLPLRPYRDDDLLDQGSDPLISLIGSFSNLREGERLVARLRLLSLGTQWAAPHQNKLHRQQQKDQVGHPTGDQARAQIHTRDGVAMAILGVAALVGLRGYFWVQNDETWKAALLGAGAVGALTLAGWGWWRIKRFRSGGKFQDPLQIRDKLSRIAYQAQLEVFAVLPDHGTEERAKQLLSNVEAAYHTYNNAAGASFKAGKVRPVVPATEPAAPSAGMLHGRNVLSARELAALWHPLGPGDQLPMIPRTGARVLQPPARVNSGGALVGDTVGGQSRPVHFSPDTGGRHHLYLARTRMGKSTLMQNLVIHKMREKARGRDPDAIIVVDPHSDLVDGILPNVPEEIIDQVCLIDLADQNRIPGINLVDSRVFPDRDRTADSVVRIARGVWEHWGPRMQSILEHTVKALHDYNSHPDTLEGDQLTILDGQRMLADLEFRKQVMKRVDDPYVNDWWFRDLPGWSRDTRSDALAPVQTRLGYYSSSKKARAILGQPRSTIDLPRVISEGGVLLASTAQGAVGPDVASLVGASLLNLVDAVIRGQGSLAPDQRRGALVVVDEMQTMPGVDYEGMLGELGKFGASFILATQSLGSLAKLSATMQETLLANVGCLAVFQVDSGVARELLGELDRERVTEEDLVSLPSYQCYVRATDGGQRLPTYSMAVRKPDAGDPRVVELVRERVADYTVSAQAVADLEALGQERVRRYRERMERPSQPAPDEPAGGSGEKPAGQGGPGDAVPGKSQSKKDREERRRQSRRGGDVPGSEPAGDGE